jgi:hypothetical protein
LHPGRQYERESQIVVLQIQVYSNQDAIVPGQRTTCLMAADLTTHRKLSTSRLILECVLVGAAAFAVYVCLYSELPIDDTHRFTQDVAEGRYEWDASHLLMQPATVVWHRWLNFGFDALASQHHINSFSAALALAILYLLGARLNVPRLECCLVLLASGLGFNVLMLATSGHMKLTALPFLALSMYHGVLWERSIFNNVNRTEIWRLLASAISLGAAALFLANAIFILPFQGLAILMRRQASSWKTAIAQCVVYCAVSLTVLFSGLVSVYLATSDRVGLAGVMEFVLGKTNVAGTSSGVVESVARAGYGTIMNFVYLENLGPLMRAKLNGQLTDNINIAPLILRDLAFAITAACLLGLIYAASLIQWGRGRPGFATLWSHWLGILIFAMIWNLNEADFFYQLTWPTFAMLLVNPWRRFRISVILLVVPLMFLANVVCWAIPKAKYPFYEYAAQLQRDFGPSDLIVCFRAWPGKQSMAFFLPHLHDHSVLVVDRELQSAGEKVAFYDELRRQLREQPYRRIVLFQILDPTDYNAPWPEMYQFGVTKQKLQEFFHEQGKISAINPIAEIPCWELELTEFQQHY